MKCNILIVAYNQSSTNNDVENVLKNQGTWWHYLKYTWLIATTDSPYQLYNKIAPYILKTDRIFIGEITNEYEGWLEQEAWDWIRKNQ
jgi:hypothetical protein